MFLDCWFFFQAFGPLTEGIQVKGSIVLADITKNGICIDLSRVEKVKRKLEIRMMKSVHTLLANPNWQGIPSLFFFFSVLLFRFFPTFVKTKQTHNTYSFNLKFD
jgi:hypothetical protein